MRIALIADQVGPLIESGTADVVTAPLAGALARRGHRVTLYARRVGVPAPAGVEVVRLSSGPAAPAVRPPTRKGRSDGDPLRHLPELTERLAAQWSADPPDLIHATSWVTGLAGIAARPDPGIPLVQTFDGLAVERHSRPLRRLDPAVRRRARLEAALARSATQIVARSTAEVAGLTRLGVPRSAVTVIPAGVDLARFTPDGPAAPRADRQRVLAFGSPAAEHGLDLAVRALRRVPDAELVVVGGPHLIGSADLVGGTDAVARPTDPAARWLAGQVTRCRIGDRVQLTGPLREEELPPLLRSADAAVFPARYEPCGAAALAAMACGVPLLATAVGALADIVAERATGELIPPRQPEAFVNALRDLLGDMTRLAGYRISAADRAQARYGWERIAADTEAAYRRVLEWDRDAVAG